MPANLSLHGLRGLAILVVFVYHLHRAVVTGGFDFQLQPDGSTFGVLELGRLGVEIFFMISGYLITASLCRHGSVGKFLFSRGKRIYPAFLVPHLLIFAAGPVIGYSWFAHAGPVEYALNFVSNLLYLPGVFDLPIAQIVAWSLSYEFAFYLTAAAAYACAHSRRPWYWRAPAAAGWLAATTWLLAAHPRGWFFVVGVAVYFSGKAVERFAARAHTGWLGLPALVAMCAVYDVSFASALLLGTVAFTTVVAQRGWLAALLRTRPLGYLGTVSYSLYLWHPIVLFPLKRLFALRGGLLASDWLNLGLFALSATVLSLAASHASYELVERRLTERVFGRRGGHAGAVLTAAGQGTVRATLALDSQRGDPSCSSAEPDTRRVA